MSRLLPFALFVVMMSAPVLAADVPAKVGRPCSMDAMSQADKQEMIDEHARRQRVYGKANADEWAREQGRAFRRKLVIEGVCPPLPAEAEQQVARRAPPPARQPATDKPVLNKQGSPCKTIRMEPQLFPNFGGAPMTMALIPVCSEE